jgi:hypothetical protein
MTMPGSRKAMSIKVCRRMRRRTAVREASRARAPDSPVPGEGRTPERPGQMKKHPGNFEECWKCQRDRPMEMKS